MSIEIKDVRLILPAMVSFVQNGEEFSTFVYIDQARKDVVVPDSTDILDIEAFKKAFKEHYNSKNPLPKVPTMPNKEIFNKTKPNVNGDFNE
jgi:hypothetical protein